MYILKTYIFSKKNIYFFLLSFATNEQPYSAKLLTIIADRSTETPLGKGYIPVKNYF